MGSPQEGQANSHRNYNPNIKKVHGKHDGLSVGTDALESTTVAGDCTPFVKWKYTSTQRMLHESPVLSLAMDMART